MSRLYVRFIKRVLDVLFGLLLFPFLVLVIILFSPIIWFFDHGHVFYNSQRLGRNGRVFTMYKFRSMKENAPDIRNADGSTFNSDDDPRVTRIGAFLRKTSIDELPQLLNVIKGDMSFVGPRPNLPSVPFDQLPDIEQKRLAVRPGITGYNQAYFRNSVKAAEKFEHDLYYIENISFGFDIRILMKTIVSVVFRRSINSK